MNAIKENHTLVSNVPQGATVKKLYSLCYFIPRVFKHYARENKVKFLIVVLSVISSHAAETPLVRAVSSQQAFESAKQLPVELQSKIAPYLIPRSFLQAKNMGCLRMLQGPNHSVNSVAFNHDGSLLASGSYDETINIWDLGKVKLMCTQ